MTLYLDTSALVKLYFEESGSAEVRERVRQAAVVATSRVAYIETLSGIARKNREGELAGKDRTRVTGEFLDDWKSFFVIEVSEPLCRLAGDLVTRHPLRTLDAVHLASALLLRDKLEEKVEFCGFDQRLGEAARLEGLWSLV